MNFGDGFVEVRRDLPKIYAPSFCFLFIPLVWSEYNLQSIGMIS